MKTLRVSDAMAFVVASAVGFAWVRQWISLRSILGVGDWPSDLRHAAFWLLVALPSFLIATLLVTMLAFVDSRSRAGRLRDRLGVLSCSIGIAFFILEHALFGLAIWAKSHDIHLAAYAFLSMVPEYCGFVTGLTMVIIIRTGLRSAVNDWLNTIGYGLGLFWLIVSILTTLVPRLSAYGIGGVTILSE